MSDEPVENGSYYFWKWADNDLPGPPREVHAALLRGTMHPALQTFDTRPLLRKLEGAAKRGRLVGEEWEWQVQPASSPQQACFVFVSCPPFDRGEAAIRRFLDALSPLDLSGFDERKGIVIQGLLPKNNCFLLGQSPFDRAYDISEDDLPRLIRSIRPNERDPFGILESRRFHFVQCLAKGRRFIVEWRENYDLRDFSKFDQWKAQDRKRLDALDVPYTANGIPQSRDPDLITYTATLEIFRAFLRGESRPAEYHWRNISAELP